MSNSATETNAAAQAWDAGAEKRRALRAGLGEPQWCELAHLQGVGCELFLEAKGPTTYRIVTVDGVLGATAKQFDYLPDGISYMEAMIAIARKVEEDL